MTPGSVRSMIPVDRAGSTGSRTDDGASDVARFRAMAWMGGWDLDLTDAELAPHGSAMELVAVLGKGGTQRPRRAVLMGRNGTRNRWTDRTHISEGQ